MIQGKVPSGSPSASLPEPRTIKDARTVLLVNAPEALDLLDARPDRQSVVLTQMRMLGEQMLRTVRPDAIVAPLITAEWDIVDLGILLEDMGFRGDLFAMTRPLPRAELVIRELRDTCPRLNVSLLETL